MIVNPNNPLNVNKTLNPHQSILINQDSCQRGSHRSLSCHAHRVCVAKVEAIALYDPTISARQVLGVTAMAMGAGLRGGARMEVDIRSSFERGNPFIPHQIRHSSTLKMRSRTLSGLAMAGMSYEVLEARLGSGEWALADEETRRLLIVLAGDAAVKRNYVFFSEVKFIPASDLQAIDQLWRKHSNSRFGYSVQRRIWNKVNRDFTEFFKKVGWMKLLKNGEGEQEHYSYRSFPAEFVWDLGDSTPEGHLPLTNALRGTQLLSTILQHPAFNDQDQLLV